MSQDTQPVIHAPVATIEVALNTRDGTYRLQETRESEGGRRIERTVFAPSIPEGLRDLAAWMVADAVVEFVRRPG